MAAHKSSVLRKEIYSQPKVLERILKRERKTAERLARWINGRNHRLVMIVGRGSADNAGLYGKYLFGAHNKKVVALATPSLITRYGKVPDLKDVLVIALSQSGESHDVVEVVEAARKGGALTVAVTNTKGSPLAEAAEEVLFCHAGLERSVAATKTYTAQLLLLALLSAAVEGGDRIDRLAGVPEYVEAALTLEPLVLDVAERLRYVEHCSVVGRGYCYGTAFEIALKLAELTYVIAQPYSSADFRHGPIAVVNKGFCVLLIAPSGRVLADVKELQKQLEARGAEVIALSDVSTVLRRATIGLQLSALPEWLAPLSYVVPGQLLAMNLARVKGLPVDAPRGPEQNYAYALGGRSRPA